MDRLHWHHKCLFCENITLPGKGFNNPADYVAFFNIYFMGISHWHHICLFCENIALGYNVFVMSFNHVNSYSSIFSDLSHLTIMCLIIPYITFNCLDVNSVMYYITIHNIYYILKLHCVWRCFIVLQISLRYAMFN